MAEWAEIWDRPIHAVRKEMLEDYRDETLNLAQKTLFKYERGKEARVLFMLALLSLVLGISLTVGPVASFGIDAGKRVFLWSAHEKWIAGVVVAVFCALQMYDYFRNRHVEKGADKKELIGLSLYCLVLPLYVISVIALTGNLRGLGVIGVVLSVVAGIAVRVSSQAWREGKKRCDLV